MLVHNIEDLCEEHGLSITQLEKQLGISLGTIRTWKTRAPRLDTLTKVSGYFQVSIDSLVQTNKAERRKG